MKPVRRSAKALLFVVLLLASLVAPSGLANATSNYDNSYQSTETIRTWWNHQNCDPADLTLDWKSYVLDESKWPSGSDYSAARASLQAALNNGADGAWGVTQFISEIADVVQIYWTEDPTASLSWSSSGVDAVTASGGNNIHVIDLACSQKFYGTRGATPAIISVADAPSHKISTSPTWTMFYKMRNLFVHGFDLNYPSGYEGPQVLTEQPKAKYVAMGDSFSSGEGNPAFDPATNRGGTNECHRSYMAYPRLLQNNSSLNLGPAAFVTCSGATTNDVLGLSETSDPTGKWNEPAQINALSESTEKVTITIGGNDVGFGDYAYACTIMPCGPGTFDYSYIMNVINGSDFFRTLVQTYERILNRAPNAQVYVVDYPYLAIENSNTCSSVDLTGAWAVQSQLNAVIRDAVAEAAANHLSPNIHYVNTNLPSSPFRGKHLCSEGASDFHGIVGHPNTAFSLHPNTEGQNDYATVVAGWMS